MNALLELLKSAKEKTGVEFAIEREHAMAHVVESGLDRADFSVQRSNPPGSNPILVTRRTAMASVAIDYGSEGWVEKFKRDLGEGRFEAVFRI